MSMMVKRVGKYEMGRTLGEGTFGRVKYALNVDTNEAVAIKVLDKEKIQKQNMGNQIKKEISIMKMVKHEYIVSLIEVLASKTKIFIVLELISGGELFDKIVSSGKLKENEAKLYTYQLCEGVEYCHANGVCHRDLKPENLLLDGNGNLKISDFGLSSLYVGDADGDGAHRTQLLNTTCGTPNYVAPEVLSEQGYDGKKADVWSIGVIIYVLLAGFLPFDEQTISALFNKIKRADFSYPTWFSSEAKALVDQMLVADPKSRLTLTQIKGNPWVMQGANERPAAIPQPTKTIDNIGHDEDDDEDEGGTGTTPTKEKPGAETATGGGAQTVAAAATAVAKAKSPNMNVFNIVHMCGGLFLDRLLTPNIGAYGSSEEPEHNRSIGNVSSLNAHKVNVTYRFTSNRDVETLMSELIDILLSMSVEFSTSHSKMIATGKANSCTVMTPKGSVQFDIVATQLCTKNTLTLLEIKKKKGDAFQWSVLYSDIINNKCKDLINIMV